MWERIEGSGDLPSGRCKHSSVVLGDNLLILGGEGDFGPLCDGYLFNFSKFDRNNMNFHSQLHQ